MVRHNLVLSALIGAMLLTAPQVMAQEFVPDLRICIGDFALCAASTCTPTGGMIAVNTATGSRNFPEAQCTCPIFSGPAIADLNGGNMRGSCARPTEVNGIPTGDGLWSLYSIQGSIPQAINNWNPGKKKSEAPAQVCPANLGLGAQLANCFSFACMRAGKINSVEVATCFCSLGGSLEGTPISPNTAFVTQAGQCNEDTCSQHPVSGPLPFDAIQAGACLLIP